MPNFEDRGSWHGLYHKSKAYPFYLILFLFTTQIKPDCPGYPTLLGCHIFDFSVTLAWGGNLMAFAVAGRDKIGNGGGFLPLADFDQFAQERC